MTADEAAKVKKLPNVISLTKYVDNHAGIVFPNDEANYPWTIDNYGPLVVPKQGVAITLTPN
ncbi:hypothetical protein ACO1MG_13785, partial [Staphylococcus aureus]